METVKLRLLMAQLKEVLMALETSYEDIVEEEKVGSAVVLRTKEVLNCAQWGVTGFSVRENHGFCEFSLGNVTRYVVEIKGYDDDPYVIRIIAPENGDDRVYDLVAFTQPVCDKYADYYSACWIRFKAPMNRDEWEAKQAAKQSHI